MNVVTRRHLIEAAQHFPDAAKELQAWYKIAALAALARWQSFLEIRQTFNDADAVDGYAIFNIRHNRYRLITIPHYARGLNERMTGGHIYIRSFLTHKEYDNQANWNKGVKR